MDKDSDTINVKNLTLITGGARSGKSKFAETLADKASGSVMYIATMEERKDDAEAVERIKRHKERRPALWKTLEVPFHVHDAVVSLPPDTKICLIDCLSLYVSNILLELDSKLTNEIDIETQVNGAAQELLKAMVQRSEIEFIVVTNEVGWGVVPEHKLARTYRDLLGVVNQQFAAAAGAVYLSCVGLQIQLKPQKPNQLNATGRL
ncbi:MAG TPA: bifunctional adenosylcobinamide kinase/adenosylcobinamide-phosphate guanylyltransferase [Drouetiella sp.]